MALIGKLGADFTAFQAAVDAAQDKLKSFASGSATVEAALNRMTNSFTGVKVIQEATLMAEAIERVGGVATLTGDELEAAGAKMEAAMAKMRATGEPIPANIQAIADAAKSAESSWGEFVQGFSATDAIEHPLATAQQGLSALAETLGPTAVMVVGLGAAFVAAGVAAVELAEKTAKAGGELNDLSERTGISVDTLSRYSNAAKVAGSDANTLGDAFFKLQKGMGEDSTKVEQGLDRIGLSIQELQSYGPDKQLELIAQGLAGLSDPAERAAADSEIFRDKTGQLIPVLLKLNEGLQMTADIHPWTDQEAKDAERFDMQVASIKVHIEALAESFGRMLIPPLSTALDLFSRAETTLENWGWLTPVGATITGIGTAWGYAGAAMDTFRGKTELPIKITIDDDDAKKKLEDLKYLASQTPAAIAAHYQGLADAMTNTAAKAPNLQQALANLHDMETTVDKDTEKNIESGLKLQAAFADLATAGAGWKGTIDTIDGSVVESILAYRDAGVSMTTLKTIYSDLSETQLAAIEKLRTARADDLKQHQKDADDAYKLEQKTVDATTKLWDEYEVNRIKQLGSATDIKKAELDKQYNDAAANANKMGIVDQQYWDALEARWKQGTDAIGIDWAALNKTAQTQSQAALQVIADQAKATYDEALKHVGEWSAGAIDKYRQAADAAQRAATDFSQSWDDAITDISAFARKWQQELTQIETESTTMTQGELAKRAKAYQDTFASISANAAKGQVEVEKAQGEASAAYYQSQLAVNGLAKGVNELTDAQTKADQAFQAFHNTIVLDTTDIDTLNQELSKFYDKLAAQGNVGMWGPGSSVGTPGAGTGAGMGRIPSFGSGGSGDFGSGTAVMLHGKEAVVPLDTNQSSNLQFGGIPLSPPTLTINQTINITQPLGTPDAIARAVGDANVSLMKGQGIRLPYGT
jgi:predicted  nucleic acid-binding Zn-ribbon protein